VFQVHTCPAEMDNARVPSPIHREIKIDAVPETGSGPYLNVKPWISPCPWTVLRALDIKGHLTSELADTASDIKVLSSYRNDNAVINADAPTENWFSWHRHGDVLP